MESLIKKNTSEDIDIQETLLNVIRAVHGLDRQVAHLEKARDITATKEFQELRNQIVGRADPFALSDSVQELKQQVKTLEKKMAENDNPSSWYSMPKLDVGTFRMPTPPRLYSSGFKNITEDPIQHLEKWANDYEKYLVARLENFRELRKKIQLE